jgi:hypothetical protein
MRGGEAAARYAEQRNAMARWSEPRVDPVAEGAKEHRVKDVQRINPSSLSS